MSERTDIEWTDATWNPVRGCTKVSPGCKNCYAETLSERFRGVQGHPFEQGFDLRLVPEALSKPLSWRGSRRIFVNSMSDLFHDDVPFDFIAAVFGVMWACPQHTFQLLTKRPERMRRFFEWLQEEATERDPILECHLQAARHGVKLLAKTIAQAPVEWPLPNVWLGVSVETQEYVGRTATILQCPAALYFLSCEPMLGPLDLSEYIARVNWVICGGESGPRARPMDYEWAASLKDQCVDASVPFWFKQMGDYYIAGHKVHTLDGRTWDEVPK